jgi:hypothetical protein
VQILSPRYCQCYVLALRCRATLSCHAVVLRCRVTLSCYAVVLRCRAMLCASSCRYVSVLRCGATLSCYVVVLRCRVTQCATLSCCAVVVRSSAISIEPARRPPNIPERLCGGGDKIWSDDDAAAPALRTADPGMSCGKEAIGSSSSSSIYHVLLHRHAALFTVLIIAFSQTPLSSAMRYFSISALMIRQTVSLVMSPHRSLSLRLNGSLLHPIRCCATVT